MQFTGIVTSFMWDRPSSWSFQAPKHFHFTKFRQGIYISIFCAGVTWAVNCRCSDTACTASALEEGEYQDIYEKIGVTYAGGQDGGCVKSNKHTEDMRGKEGHLQNTPCQQHAERATTRSQLQWSYRPVLNPCGGSEWLTSSWFPGFVCCDDCRHRDGGFEECSAGEGWYLPGCLCWVLQHPSATLRCWQLFLALANTQA